MDKISNKNKTTENEILMVSFGSSYPSGRKAIDAIEHAAGDRFGGSFRVCRAFTSQMIIKAIERKEGIRTDSVAEALERAAGNGVRNIVVQPTHLMKGLEYDKLRETAAYYAGSFERIVTGAPMLTSDEDFSRAADAIADATGVHDEGTAVVLMGHGTSADANAVYGRMQDVLRSKGMNDYYVGTVEATPSLEDVLDEVNAGDYSRVILRPFMVVAGNHAISDMASADDPDSWYCRFRAAGYEVVPVIEGLGQIPAIQDIYIDHIRKALSELTA